MPDAENQDFNLCGVLVQTRPGDLATIENSLVDMPGVEVHGRDEAGALVLTIEDTADRLASDTMLQVNDVAGVLAATLVYHHCEPINEM